MDRLTRRPPKAVLGVPVFCGLVLLLLLAKNAIGTLSAAILLLLVVLLFPYYIVLLLMRRQMKEHLASAERAGSKPSYVPASKIWVSLYLGLFFLTAYVVMQLGRLTTA